jgi:drug/metabolite transporter (DMT)-like permease
MSFVFLLYALFASVFTVAKEALLAASPFFLLGSRMLLAGVLMLIFQYFRKGALLKLTKEQLIQVLLLGFFNIYLTNALELWGLQYLTSFKTCFLYSLSPFLTALISYLTFQETLNWKKWIGLLVGFSGFIPILLSQGNQEGISGKFGAFSGAELAVLSAVLSSVFGWIILKKLVFHMKCPYLVANGYSMLLGGLIGLVHSMLFENWNPIPVSNTLRWLECSLFLIIVSNCICYNLYGWLLKKFSSTFMSFAGLSTPLFTALFGWFFFDERPQWDFFASLMIVFFGLLMFYLEELKEMRLLSKPI